MRALILTIGGERNAFLQAVYDPPRRAPRVAPASLRPARLGHADLAQLMALFDQLEER